MKKKSIAVILTVHNRKVKTLECLSSLFKEHNNFEVFLTNDGCTDGTSEAIATTFPQVHLIEGDGTLFWNRGMYKAFEKASKMEFDFYLWLNDDTVFVSDFIQKLLDCSSSEMNKAIICGATVDNKNTEQVTYGGYTKSVKSLPLSSQKQQCYFASGNILLIPRYVFKKVGLNDFKFRHALGDFDYEGRANKLGIKVVQAPNYLGYCERHSSIPKWRDDNYSIIERIHHLYSPTGRNPYEFIYFDKRHNGVFKAIVHYFTLHLRCFFPHLFCFNYTEKE